MDLSKLSDADLEALASGDLAKVSDAGLMVMSGQEIPQPKKPVDTRLNWAEKNIAPVVENFFAATGLGSQPVQDFATGASGVMRGGANLISDGAGDAIWPRNSSGSGFETAGEFLDPAANALGGLAFKGAVKAAPVIKKGAQSLMQSALKPTLQSLKSGEAARAAATMLDEGVNATAGGVRKLQGKVFGLNDQIARNIDGSTATISKNAVLPYLDDVSRQFSTQVAPTSDLRAISSVADDFATHPSISGDTIPVKLAQQLKQGTYKTVGKKYGQLGSAEIEAQKGLARGLKEEIAKAVPEIAELNAKESALINALKVAERRSLMDANKNPLGLSLLAENPTAAMGFMADRSPLIKSLLARMLNTTAESSPYIAAPMGYSIGQGLSE